MLICIVCGMPANCTEETGGAIFSTGLMEIQDTVFAENTATSGGLAIQTLASTVLLRNVTFNDNILSCPSQTYSYTDDVSTEILSPTSVWTLLQHV